MPRIAILGGGTLGHTMPGVAVAEALPDREVLFLVGQGGREAAALADLGLAAVEIPAAPWLRTELAGKLAMPWTVMRGVAAAGRVLEREKVGAVLGLGGYVSVPPLIAARGLGLATAIHEANARAGMANRWLAGLVDVVMLGCASAAIDFPGHNDVRVVGNPVRAEVARLGADAGELADGARRVLVLGGSEGSSFVNERVPSLLGRVAGRLAHGLVVRHQTGAHDAAPVLAAYQGLGVPAKVTPYLERMGEAYAWADFAVTPAGASTLAELAHAALPALVIPRLDVALDHQRDNARAHARSGAALLADPASFDERVTADAVTGVLTDPTAWQAMSKAARALARPDAARALARVLTAASKATS